MRSNTPRTNALELQAWNYRLWQVSGRSEITDFDEVVRLDVSYIDDWTIWSDIKILLKTIKVVFKRDGAK